MEERIKQTWDNSTWPNFFSM